MDNEATDNIESTSVEQHRLYEERLARDDWKKNNITREFRKELTEKYDNLLLNAIVSRRLNDNDRALGLLSSADGIKSAIDLFDDFGSSNSVGVNQQQQR